MYNEDSKRMRGIEPLALAWKAKVLPLYDIRSFADVFIDLTMVSIFGVGVNYSEQKTGKFLICIKKYTLFREQIRQNSMI